MTNELTLYQFEDHDLIQLTDGRQPHSLPENQAGWQFKEKLPATRDGVEKVSAKAASAVLDEIGRRGYCQLNRFEIAPDWRGRHTKEGRA